MQNEAEIKAYIEHKRIAHAEIQKEIQELNEKQEAYIRKKLENIMWNAIKKQVLKKNFKFEF